MQEPRGQAHDLRQRVIPPDALRRLKLELWRSMVWQRTGTRPRPRRCGCGARFRDNPGPMLDYRVWLRIAYKPEVLCDACVRRRLGRPIRRAELVPASWNFTMWRWFWGRFSGMDLREAVRQFLEAP